MRIRRDGRTGDRRYRSSNPATELGMVNKDDDLIVILNFRFDLNHFHSKASYFKTYSYEIRKTFSLSFF